MILLVASTRWSQQDVCNTVDSINLSYNSFSNYSIKIICLNNDDEITSHAFNGYCMTIRIYVEHQVEHVHILVRSKFLMFSLTHAILHVAILILIMSTRYS